MNKSNTQGTEGKEEMLDRTLKPEQIEQIAYDAYVWGMPAVVSYGVRYTYTQNLDSDQFAGLNNLIYQDKAIDHTFTSIVSPAASTLYGFGWADLTNSEIVIEVPQVSEKDYYTIMLMDQHGDILRFLGTPFTGIKKQKFLLVGPNWSESRLSTEDKDKFPTTHLIRSHSNIHFVGVRMPLKDREEGMAEEVRMLRKLQEQITLTPFDLWKQNGEKGISAFERKRVPGNYKTLKDKKRMAEVSQKLVERQTPMEFFTFVSFILNDPSMTIRTDSIKEMDVINRLAKIGIKEGSTFNPEELKPEVKQALEKGFNRAKAFIKSQIKARSINMNGWLLAPGDKLGRSGTDYVCRAVAGDFAWGAPTLESHTAASAFTDSKGEMLHGSNKYTITFDINDLPPVDVFWSIPLYDADGYFTKNEIDRVAINSYMYEAGKLHVEDGKLVIYVQHEKPEDPNKVKNWLPAPKDSFRFAARFYGPKLSLSDGSYNMPPVIKVQSYVFAADELKPIHVNVDNFVRAETAVNFDRNLKLVGGKINKFFSIRKPVSIDEQIVIRSNRDTLYAGTLVDISKGAVLTLPDTGGRYISAMIINEDHYINKIYSKAGTYKLTMKEFDTPYVMLVIRILVDASDPEDIKKVNALQDLITLKSVSAKPYTHPNYDPVSYKKTFDAILELGRGVPDLEGTFGAKEEVGKVRHLLGTALGWGGLPEKEAFYFNVNPNLPVGAYQLTVKDVPVDAFWSISLYNKDGFFQKNKYDSYTVNNITGTPNKDGSFTVHFGGDPKSVNYLPIMEGWNYLVRLYKPRKEILDRTWVFPSVKPVK